MRIFDQSVISGKTKRCSLTQGVAAGKGSEAVLGRSNSLRSNGRRSWRTLFAKYSPGWKTGAVCASAAAVVVLLGGCASVVYEPSLSTRPKMSLSEARQIIAGAFEHSSPRLENVKVSIQGFTCTEPTTGAAYTFQFEQIQHPSVQNAGFGHFMTNLRTADPFYVSWPSKEEPEHLVDAIQAMKHDSTDDAFTEFQEKAKAWRASSRKVVLEGEAYRFKVLAEDAFQGNDFPKAVDYYEKGLAAEPMWPDGQLRAALIYGELQLYKPAAIHMKRYLELCPDAKDARKCRDQLIIWDEKSGSEPQPATVAPTK